MSRSLTFAFSVALAAHAAVLPEQIWEHKRIKSETLQPTEPVWAEYGFEAGEKAVYQGTGGTMTVTAWRLKDPTSALGVYQWREPQGLGPAKLYKTGVESANRAFLLVGNYVLDFEGRLPTLDEFGKLYVQLPRLDQSALPALSGFLPPEGLVPGSKRFITGPAALDQFLPGVSPSLAGFSLGAEIQTARYRLAGAETTLAIVSYPTPQMARDKLAEFQKLSGSVAKRSGPLVAVAMGPAGPDAAERLLAKVNYQATVTWNENPAKKEMTLGEMIITIFILIGILMVASVGGGVLWAGIRTAYRKSKGRTGDEDSVMTLGIDRRA